LPVVHWVSIGKRWCLCPEDSSEVAQMNSDRTCFHVYLLALFG
jgi:hypothetical protein